MRTVPYSLMSCNIALSWPLCAAKCRGVKPCNKENFNASIIKAWMPGRYMIKKLTPWGRERKDGMKKREVNYNCNMLKQAAVHACMEYLRSETGSEWIMLRGTNHAKRGRIESCGNYIYMCIYTNQTGNSWLKEKALTDLISTWAPFRIIAEMISQRPCFAAQCNAVCWVCVCVCVKKRVYGREEIVFQLMHTTMFPVSSTGYTHIELTYCVQFPWIRGMRECTCREIAIKLWTKYMYAKHTMTCTQGIQWYVRN